MTESLFQQGPLEEAVQALRADLLAEDGPQISTMRNYRFAILPYRPADEFRLRRHIRHLSDELRARGWCVLSIALHALLLERLRRVEEGRFVESLVAMEKRLHRKDPERALNHLREKLVQHIEGANGLAADVAHRIAEVARANPGQADRTVVFLGRAGALYPFFRSSALLKHIDGRTGEIPVVLLYPGERQEVTALSFMGELPPDRDYRPRIYP